MEPLKNISPIFKTKNRNNLILPKIVKYSNSISKKLKSEAKENLTLVKNPKTIITDEKYPMIKKTNEKILLEKISNSLRLVNPENEKVCLNMKISNELIHKYIDMLNNDNDLHYLEINFQEKCDEFLNKKEIVNKEKNGSIYPENIQNAILALRQKENLKDLKLTSRKTNFNNNSYKYAESTNVSSNISNYFNKNLIQFPVFKEEEIDREFKKKGYFNMGIYLKSSRNLNYDIGFINFYCSKNKSNCFMQQFYICKIYRKMKYYNFILLEIFLQLFESFKFKKIKIKLKEKNEAYLKLLKLIGFKLESIINVNHEKSQCLILSRDNFIYYYNLLKKVNN